jgi:nicotinate phosphoribosyltransferase
VRFKLINRSCNNISPAIFHSFQEQINAMSGIGLTDTEQTFLEKRCGDFLDPAFIDLLKGFRYNPDEVCIRDGHVEVEAEAYRAGLWEMPVLSILQELYFQDCANLGLAESTDVANQRACAKATKLRENGCFFADFGTRRRYSVANHDAVVRGLIEGGRDNFVGTSNVHLAQKYSLKPIGTQAHWWFQLHAAKYGYRMANRMALSRWVDIFSGRLGIALTDTFGTKDFLRTFDVFFGKLFDGLRHDSGCPFRFGDMVIEHYKRLGIDPKSKTIVFSDGLDVDKAIAINNYLKGKIKVSFGIGTHFTNDVGVKPVSLVFKLWEVLVDDEWVPAVKLSDDIGKNTGDPAAIQLAKQVLGVCE